MRLRFTTVLPFALLSSLPSLPSVAEAANTFTIPPKQQCDIILRRSSASDAEHEHALEEEREQRRRGFYRGPDKYFDGLWRGVRWTHRFAILIWPPWLICHASIAIFIPRAALI